MSKPLRVLVVGCGNMGSSHARAYFNHHGFEIAGLVANDVAGRQRLAATVGNPPQFDDFAAALAATRPDCVSVNTYPDTHAAFARAAFAAGCHVFTEKPIAVTVASGRACAAG